MTSDKILQKGHQQEPTSGWIRAHRLRLLVTLGSVEGYIYVCAGQGM